MNEVWIPGLISVDLILVLLCLIFLTPWSFCLIVEKIYQTLETVFHCINPDTSNFVKILCCTWTITCFSNISFTSSCCLWNRKSFFICRKKVDDIYRVFISVNNFMLIKFFEKYFISLHWSDISSWRILMIPPTHKLHTSL